MQDVLNIPSVTGVDLNLRIAGPGARSYAFIIDWHIRLLAALVWFFIGTLLVIGSAGVVGNLSPDAARIYALGVTLPALAIYFLYHPVIELIMAGRTPGKRMAGVRIVRTDGAIPGFGSLLVRNVFRLIDCLPAGYFVGLAVALLTQHSVRIGDIAAGTVLVYDEEEEKSFYRYTSAALARVGMERIEIVRDLLMRWDTLDPDVREGLAKRLLAAVGEPPSGESDLALLEALERVLERGDEA